MSTKEIEQLFFKQMKKLTLKSYAETYDYQFSDAWMR